MGRLPHRRAEVAPGPDQRLDPAGRDPRGLVGGARGADDPPALRQEQPREGRGDIAMADGEEHGHGARYPRAPPGVQVARGE